MVKKVELLRNFKLNNRFIQVPNCYLKYWENVTFFAKGTKKCEQSNTVEQDQIVKEGEVQTPYFA